MCTTGPLTCGQGQGGLCKIFLQNPAEVQESEGAAVNALSLENKPGEWQDPGKLPGDAFEQPSQRAVVQQHLHPTGPGLDVLNQNLWVWRAKGWGSASRTF